MFIQVTGLDGSGTSSIAERLKNKSDNAVVLKTPSNEYEGRKIIDTVVRQDSKVANMLYYLSSTVYMSDYIKNHYDLKETDVYVVRYLIDTVVSNRVAGIPIDLNYNIYGNNLLVPDLTLFIYTDEEIRQNRITNRGKSELDKVLLIQTIRPDRMENALKDFKGTVMFSDSDHEFIQAVATRIIDITPDGTVDRISKYDDFLANETVQQQISEKYKS